MWKSESHLYGSWIDLFGNCWTHMFGNCSCHKVLATKFAEADEAKKVSLDNVEKWVSFYYVWSPEHSVSAKGTRGLGDLLIFLCLIMWKSESWSEAKSIEANRRSAFLC